MPVSREDVIYAYRLILGREPESELVIQDAMQAQDIAHLRGAFLGSPEFTRKMEGGAIQNLPIGRFFNVADDGTDLACSPEQLQQMFERIGAAWRAFGETEPHWSVIVSDEYRQDNLEPNLDRFYASGAWDVETLFNFLRRAGLPTTFTRALDFGCGVGRLSLALTSHAQHVTGVDISPPHLKLAAERAREQNIANVAFEPLGAVEDLDRFQGYDFILSLIVLQHNPPPVMAALYEKLLRALAPGGTAIVQMPTYIRGQNFSAAEYLGTDQPQMEMNALPQQAIHQIIQKTGCRLIEAREDMYAGHPDVLSHVFVVQKL